MMIGERLQELRKDAGLSQKDLGKLLNISYHTISSYERNISSPSDETYTALAKLFNISIDYLIGAVDYRKPLNEKSESNVLTLPLNIPDEAVREIQAFRDFVISRYEKNNQNTNDQDDQKQLVNA